MPFCAPQIVYSGSLLAQTSAPANATLVTSPGEGIYRVSAALYVFVNPTPLSGSQATVSLTVNGPDGNTFTPSAGAGNNPFTTGEGIVIAAGIFAGTPGGTISVSGGSISDPGGILNHFDLLVTVEQLQ